MVVACWGLFCILHEGDLMLAIFIFDFDTPVMMNMKIKDIKRRLPPPRPTAAHKITGPPVYIIEQALRPIQKVPWKRNATNNVQQSPVFKMVFSIKQVIR